MGPSPYRFRREAVSVAIVAVVLPIYLPFMDRPWSAYAAVCAGYTVLIFGMLWSDRKWSRYIGANKRSTRTLLQGHAAYLLAVIVWMLVCQFCRPWLPSWIFDDFYRGITPHLFFGGLGIVAIWWVEQSWLAKPSQSEEPN